MCNNSVDNNGLLWPKEYESKTLLNPTCKENVSTMHKLSTCEENVLTMHKPSKLATSLCNKVLALGYMDTTPLVQESKSLCTSIQEW